MADPRPVLGIFAGGASRRMGGLAKGTLPAPDTGEPLVVRLARLADGVGLRPVLVGGNAEYRALLPELPVLVDQPTGIGPLGGLSALLTFSGDEPALACACDMPAVSASVLERLLSHAPGAPVVATRRDNRWEPLLARYSAEPVLPVLRRAVSAGVRSFQRLLSELPVVELPLDDELRQALEDWDRPEDVPRS